jgi:hypothetical protein
MDGMTSVSSPSYKCRYCEKEFRKESTLAAHLCEQKRRWQQEKETGVQLGLRAYLRFYETTQGSAKLKSYQDFVTSPYYTAFVKFGRYCVDVRVVNVTSFADWLLKNNKKLDQWCKDSFYETWLIEYIRKESVQDALERALKEMQDHAEQNTALASFNHYFMYGNSNRICHHISSGRISPWIVYNCASGIEFLDKLDPGQIEIITPWIDPDYWQKKFQDYMADTEWTRHVLKEAGL